MGSWPAGGADGYLTAFDPATAALAWSTRLGGQDDDIVTDVVIDAAGTMLVTGGTRSPHRSPRR